MPWSAPAGDTAPVTDLLITGHAHLLALVSQNSPTPDEDTRTRGEPNAADTTPHQVATRHAPTMRTDSSK